MSDAENEPRPIPKKENTRSKLKSKINSLNLKIKQSFNAKKQQNSSFRVEKIFQKESAGFLEAEEGEQTLKFRQEELKPLLPIANLQNIFNLDLNFGSYNIDYTRDGKNLLLGGTLGHLALMDWKKKDLICEFNVKETIRDICFLNNENMFAVAQKRYLYIYDNNGIELHRLKNHLEPSHLQYLPYHYLLVSASRLGFLKYHDISTGEIVAEYRTKNREPCSMRQNLSNGIISIGDNRGQVLMYSPNTSQPLVQLYCHKTQVNTIAHDNSGFYMISSGSDNSLKVWDLRMYKMLHQYHNSSEVISTDISQTGLLAVGTNSLVEVWKGWSGEKQHSPYMKQETYQKKVIHDIKFVPYEDFLGIGADKGFSSITVPGAGEPNYDTFEVNLFPSKNQKREAEVKKLLDKLPASSITINPNIIGTVDEASKEVIEAETKAEKEEKQEKLLKKKKKKLKARGRSTSAKEFQKKERVHDVKTRERIQQESFNKLKLKKAEKEKVKREINFLENLDEELDFDPVKELKRLKKK